MTKETIVLIGVAANVAIGIGIWVYNLYIARTVGTLKNITDSLQSAFTSLRESSDYFKNVQDAVRSLYDPAEVEKLVKMRVEAHKHEVQEKLDALQGHAAQAQSSATSLKQQLEQQEESHKQQLALAKEQYGKDLAQYLVFISSLVITKDDNEVDALIKATKEMDAEIPKVEIFIKALRSLRTRVQETLKAKVYEQGVNTSILRPKSEQK